MPELHLKQPVVTYSASGPFIKHCERIQKFTEKVNLKDLYRNELDKACFAHDAAFYESKNLAKNISYNILKDRALYNGMKSCIWWISKGIRKYGL